MEELPKLYVEGDHDISVISALLAAHGVDTKRGEAQLKIIQRGSDSAVLGLMPIAIAAGKDVPVGFVLDIDGDCRERWNTVRAKLLHAKVEAPQECPRDGFIGKVADYPANCGVWLMPDCVRECGKLEHLVETLIPNGDPLWPHAETSTSAAARLIKTANEQIVDPNDHWNCFRDVDAIKAQIHAWIAWQGCTGAMMGTAIRCEVLEKESPSARAFLNWLGRLYNFPTLCHPTSG